MHGPAVDQILADEQYDSAQPAAQGDVLWPLTDHQGTVRDVASYDDAADTTRIRKHIQFDSFGNNKGEDFYDPQGNSIPDTDPDAVDHAFGFTGRAWDDDVDLYYYRARWYDPAVGRFISEDPTGFDAGDANLYRYVTNSPLNFTDPSGLGFFREVFKVFRSVIDAIRADIGAGALDGRFGNGSVGGFDRDLAAFDNFGNFGGSQFGSDSLPIYRLPPVDDVGGTFAFDSNQARIFSSFSFSTSSFGGGFGGPGGNPSNLFIDTTSINRNLTEAFRSGRAPTEAPEAATVSRADVQYTSSFWAGLKAGTSTFFQNAWDTFKIFDQDEALRNADNLRNAGFGQVSAGTIGLVAELGERLGFGSLENARSGLSKSNERLGPVQRGVEVVSGTVQIGFQAFGIKTTLANAGRSAIGGVGSFFSRARGFFRVRSANSSAVERVGGQARDWLGEGYVVKRHDTAGAVFQSKDKLRQFRLDLRGHGDLPHAHLQMRGSVTERFKDVPGVPHRLYFQGVTEP